MVIYYGIVKGNVVVLPEDASLPDGSEVEVRLLASNQDYTKTLEALFRQKLHELGLLHEIRTGVAVHSEEEGIPIRVSGKPLSQEIIEDRR